LLIIILDSKTTFDEAIGVSTYSNSKAGVLLYVFIFENLWKQIEMYEAIKKSHEQLTILESQKLELKKEQFNLHAIGDSIMLVRDMSSKNIQARDEESNFNNLFFYFIHKICQNLKKAPHIS
jgi:hypothetical protein